MVKKMWTERKEIKTERDDVFDYIYEMDSFHDYRIESIIYLDKDKVGITVEEDTPIKSNEGLIWDFEFMGVRDFKISVDCVLAFCIDEIVKGDKEQEMVFSLGNGTVSIVADSVRLGIPEKEQKKQ